MTALNRKYNIKRNGRKSYLNKEQCIEFMEKLISKNQIAECLQILKDIVVDEGFCISFACRQVCAILMYCIEHKLVIPSRDNSEDENFYKNLYWLYNYIRFREEKKYIKIEFFRAFVTEITMLHPLSCKTSQPAGYSEMREQWINETIINYSEKTDNWRLKICFKKEMEELKTLYNNAVEQFMHKKKPHKFEYS